MRVPDRGVSSPPPMPMRIVPFLSLIALAVGCAQPGPAMDESAHPLVGTWRLVEWTARDSSGVWQEEFGSDPRGVFIYGPTGSLSIHLMHEDGANVSDCGPGPDQEEEFLVSPPCYVGYFGTYRIEDDSTVVHQPSGGTMLSYIGTEQPRRFEVRGDSLWIERSESVHHLLLRVQ